MQCIGSAQHLKAKFGSGYSADFKLGSPLASTIDRIIAAIRSSSGTAPLPLTVDAVKALCAKLGKDKRADELSDTGSGNYALGIQLSRRV